jgi:leader peptidase (prepilin peptidase) / N-methyltransferase
MGEIAALFEASPGVYIGFVLVLGLVVGSFLNVVIYRLPIMLEHAWKAEAQAILADSPLEEVPTAGRLSLSYPRSSCPACKAPIKAWQNIPLVSWLLLRGRCASCRAPIPIRYPLVELATGLLSGAVAWHFGLTPAAGCALIITWCFIALAGIDIDHQILPDDITIPLLWLGLLASVVIGPIEGRQIPVSPFESVVGSVCGYVSLWLVYQTYKLVTGKEGMGYGDFKLFAVQGAWLGYKLLPVIILLSAATGAVIGIALIVLKGREKAAPLPFGPYLAAAGWLAMMWGDVLVNGYLQISGLHH